MGPVAEKEENVYLTKDFVSEIDLPAYLEVTHFEKLIVTAYKRQPCVRKVKKWQKIIGRFCFYENASHFFILDVIQDVL